MVRFSDLFGIDLNFYYSAKKVPQDFQMFQLWLGGKEGKERDNIEGKAGRRRRIEEEKVEAEEEAAGLRRVKRRRSGMFGGILAPSLTLSHCSALLQDNTAGPDGHRVVTLYPKF